MIRRLTSISLLIAVISLAAGDLAAQSKQRVRFARGSSSTIVKGTIRGYAYRDYVVAASAGRTVAVRLRSSQRFGVFSIFLPNGDNLDGAAQIADFAGELPIAGDYVIRVGMMRAEARRGSVSNYSLTISIN